ncbi:MAG: cbb3-type cytochrome oxidase assembly protein CcoS [Nitrospinota bacterium]|nr:cbb3-type cytochrome oxidase assembly protein CcoS [Nitrospinota bacterium]
MSVLYWLVPAIILVGFLAVLILFWSIKSGQYEDLEGPPNRILLDDDDPKLPWNKSRKERSEDR